MLEHARLDIDEQDDILRSVRRNYGSGGWCAIRSDGSCWAGDGLGAIGKGDTWYEALAALAWSRKGIADARAAVQEGRLVRFVQWLLSARGESW